MAYVDQNMSKEKTVSAVITAIILIAVGYAFYTGLAFNIIKKAAKDLNVIDIQDQPPPPPKAPPPPPQQQKVETPPIVAPPPLVSPPVVSAPTIVTVPHPPPVVITPQAAPAPPPRPSQAIGAKPRGSPGSWVTSDDYPPGALRNEEQGRTGFKLDIDATGHVTNCTVVGSSGFGDLDETACKLLVRRGRFTPAKDVAGNGMPATYTSTVVWQIPKD